MRKDKAVGRGQGFRNVSDSERRENAGKEEDAQTSHTGLKISISM